jgi:cyclopropane fatty-acyl-phospholipid synthase-like methyltransferase
MIIPRSAIADVASVAEHYDDLDDLYRSIWGSSLHHGYWITGKESAEEAVINLTHMVARLASIRSGDQVCDIGAGYGATTLALNRDYGAEVTGITISTKQYRQAKAAAAGNLNVNFLLGDALQNSLPSAAYDAVVAVESSEHFIDKPKLFCEAYRLLRPGGRCVIAAWLTREHPGWWEAQHLLEPICAEGRIPSMASVEEYRAMLETAGFCQIRFFELTRSVKKTWTICARRLVKHFFTDATLRRRLRDPSFTNRNFAKTVFRIRLAYETGAMRYGLLTAQK